MKFAKIAFTTLTVMLVVGCQRPYDAQRHTTFQDKTTFQTTEHLLLQDLRRALSPLTKREEQGHVSISMQGGDLDLLTQQQLRFQLTEYLQLPVLLTYQSSSQGDISGELAVVLVPETCRYNLKDLTVSAYTCQQLRNRFLSVANKSTWTHGEEYQDSSSALSTGAVQRLLNNQIKSAEKQPVTGE